MRGGSGEEHDLVAQTGEVVAFDDGIKRRA